MISEICFKTIQGWELGGGGSRARTRWTMSGQLLELADGYNGELLYFHSTLNMFEFFYNKN